MTAYRLNVRGKNSDTRIEVRIRDLKAVLSAEPAPMRPSSISTLARAQKVYCIIPDSVLFGKTERCNSVPPVASRRGIFHFGRSHDRN
jgi:hypothetical protein